MSLLCPVDVSTLGGWKLVFVFASVQNFYRELLLSNVNHKLLLFSGFSLGHLHMGGQVQGDEALMGGGELITSIDYIIN